MSAQAEVLYCKVCAEFMPEPELVTHIEEIHVGPGEELKVECSDCQFKVSKTRLQLMVNHCIKTRHNLSGVHYDWKGEEQRLQEILKFNYAMKLGERDESSPPPSPVRTPVVAQPKRKQLHPQLRLVNRHSSGQSTASAAEDREGDSCRGKRGSKTDSRLSDPLPRKKQKAPRDPSPHTSESPEPLSVPDSGEGGIVENEEVMKLEDVFADGYEQEQESQGEESQEEAGREEEEEPENEETPKISSDEPKKKKKSSKKPALQVTCTYCEAELKPHGNIDMVKHVMTHQTEYYPFFCNTCDYRAGTKYNIRKHCLSKHGSGDETSHTTNMPEETVQALIEFIKKSLPEIPDWDHRLKNGIPGVTNIKPSLKFAM